MSWWDEETSRLAQAVRERFGADAVTDAVLSASAACVRQRERLVDAGLDGTGAAATDLQAALKVALRDLLATC